MKILLELEINNEKEAELKYKFVNLLVDDLKDTLYNHISEINTIKVEKAILSSKQILWTTKQKPKSIDVDKCIKYIIDNIVWYERKNNKFIVQLNKSKKFPNTNNQLSTVANLIEYGSAASLPLHFFSKYFNEFANKARVYWSSYKKIKTTIKLKEIVTVI